ncbi:MAG TPA: DEAD/DEAH box helicase [Polyangia bacterium]|jgi:superfamily II DNA or RNA helicase
MDLRPYQRECLTRLHARYRAGQRRLLVSLPTGTGKTVIFAQFPRFFAMKRRLLVLAHREELLDQAVGKFQAVNPGLTVGVEQAGRRAGDAQVVVASVPTLRGARLGALAPAEFYLVVVDEAHHAVAPSYRAIFDHFGLLEPGTPRMLVGFTATPRRGDRQPLGAVFEEIAYSKSLEEMIAAGFLCPITGYRVTSEVSLDAVRVRAGDFVESDLARAVNVTARNDLLLAAYRKLAPGRRCVAFCADVAHARSVAATFRDASIRAAAVYGAMPLAERRDTLARFHAGALDVVTNCNVLTEGFDEPRVDCIIMARPTRSLLLYAQMIGRGTRLAPRKDHLLVIDVVDNSRKHSLAGLARLFDLPEGLDLRGADVLRTARELQALAARAPWVDLERLTSAGEIPLAAERLELFRFEPPEAIAGATGLAWVGDAGGGYRLGLPGGERFLVRPTLLGDHEVLFQRPGAPPQELARAPGAAAAVQEADRLVARRHPDALKLLAQDASWRGRPATEKQLAVLRARGIPAPATLTRGQASWMLAYALRRT